MPELPEVEFGRQLLEEITVGRRIIRVEVADDTIVFEGDGGPSAVQRALVGRTVQQAHRCGKQLWLELDRGPHPLFHFGMTGAFRYPDDQPLRLAAHGSKALNQEWPPRFCKILLEVEDGGQIAMVNPRRFGRIRLREWPPAEKPLRELGPDPLGNLPTKKEWALALSQRKGILKSLLLDQRFLAGIGNWIADEVLYQAAIDPRRAARDLSPEEAERLRRAIARVLKKAVAVDAEKSRFPKSWLFHRRWGKEKGATDHVGNPLKFLTLGGRTTAWVPAVQR